MAKEEESEAVAVTALHGGDDALVARWRSTPAGNETMRHSQGQAARARVLSDFSLEVVGRQLRHFVFGQPGASSPV
ncbi:MAG: hypothetical protein U0163_12325 [Gemmatimonadaceae bacterium]